jgi:hypothetical protein
MVYGAIPLAANSAAFIHVIYGEEPQPIQKNNPISSSRSLSHNLTIYRTRKTMPKQRIIVQSASQAPKAKPTFLGAAYAELTSPENASIVRSVVIFGVSSASCEAETRG